MESLTDQHYSNLLQMNKRKYRIVLFIEESSSFHLDNDFEVILL